MARSFEDSLQSHGHLLGDAVAQQVSVRESTLRAEQLGKVQVPIVPIHLDETMSLAEHQTPFRDQLGRGTCYSFAACAAVEAAYHRKYGLTLQLSVQYAFHVNKAFELFPNYVSDTRPYENNSSMMGFQGSSDIIDKMTRCAVPLETAAKYLPSGAMAALQASIPAAGTLSNQEQYDALEFDDRHVPTSARCAAVYQVSDYRALPVNPSVADICAVIRSGHEVVADITGHCFLIIGFDDNRRVFLVKNSWGENAFIEYSYDSAVLGGRYVLDVHPPNAEPQKRALWIGRWQMDHDGWVGELVIRRFTDFHVDDSATTKLGSYYRGGKRYDVNGRSTGDGHSLEFYIADTTSRVAPGSTTGQRFEVHVFSSDPTNAAGRTTSDGVDYGVRLSRLSSGHDPIGHFEPSLWVDHWEMNHDGRRGRLEISSIDPLDAIYEPADGHGRRLSVTGELSPSHSHILSIRIPLEENDPQHFALYHHTWEAGVFSGVTTSGGQQVGVIGNRVVPETFPSFPLDPIVVPAFVYAIEPGGRLLWYRHDGAENGGGLDTWRGPAVVGGGWDGLTHVFPGGGDVIYAIRADGRLIWYEHKGFNTGLGLKSPDAWAGGKEVGHGWVGLTSVFSGGDGVIYAITADGKLQWFRHHAVAIGAGLETAGSWSGPNEVAFGWNAFAYMFSTGEGIIYGVAPDGELWWYRHARWADGKGLETRGAWEGPRSVGRGWNELSRIFSRGDGIIYGVWPDGTLSWYRHDGFRTGAGLDDPGAWRARIDVGFGWGGFTSVFALLPRAPDVVR
jgi:tachylectin